MRLTLRTLLAWIDGTLAAEDAAALGDKVAASPVAPQLIERMRRVVEHDGVSAPSPTGKGLADDPNTAAAFLDNALDPEILGAFERVCIESDSHLADVASAHRLLAEVVRDPTVAARPDRRLREALVARVVERISGDGQGIGTAAAAGQKPTARRRAGRASRGGDHDAGGSQRNARRAPVWAWVSVAAAAALLLTAAGVLAWSAFRRPGDRTGGTHQVAAARVPQDAPLPAPSAPDRAEPRGHAPTATEPVEPSPEPVNPNAPDTASEQASGPSTAPLVPQASLSPGSQGAAAGSAAPSPSPSPAGAEATVDEPPVPGWQPPVPALTSEARVQGGDALALVPAAPGIPVPATARGNAAPGGAPSGAGGPGAPAGAHAGEAAPAARPQGAETLPGVQRVGGPLLRRIEVDGRPAWGVMPGDAECADHEDLVAPAWCHPEFTVEGIVVRLEPGSRVVVTRDAENIPWLELLFGRCVIAAAAADARIGVVAGGLRGMLSGVLRQPAGVEVRLRHGPDGVPHAQAAIHAGGAEKVWSEQAADPPAAAGQSPERMPPERTSPDRGFPDRGFPDRMLPAGSRLLWDSLDPAPRLMPGSEADWLGPVPQEDRTMRAAAVELAARLGQDPQAAVGPVLQRMAADPRNERRMVATATRAVLGEYDDLVSLLCREDREDGVPLGERQWTDLEAATVPLAFARGEKSAAALAAAFQAAAPAGKGDLLASLARGFTDADLQGGGDRLLVEALDDTSLAVRRYAIRRLVEILPPDPKHASLYRADRPPLLRQDGTAWWREQLAQGRIRQGGSGGQPAAPR